MCKGGCDTLSGHDVPPHVCQWDDFAAATHQTRARIGDFAETRSRPHGEVAAPYCVVRLGNGRRRPRGQLRRGECSNVMDKLLIFAS